MPSTSESRIKKNQESERIKKNQESEWKVKTLFGNRCILQENISWVNGRRRLVQADAKTQINLN